MNKYIKKLKSQNQGWGNLKKLFNTNNCYTTHSLNNFLSPLPPH